MTGRLRIGLLLLPAALLALVLLTTAADDEGGVRYRVQLDNSYGLTEGSDARVAGVRAGVVKKIRLDERRLLADVEFELTERGFGDLRRDVSCQTRPQSLIGEYFLDCDPGKSDERFPEGGTIPVKQTSSVVPPDLVQNIMRRPYRERFAILISELGIGLAGRGDDVNEIIRRANPALREVNRVLRVLARERRTISGLYRDADTILAQVARRRRDVSRFFREARDTTRAYAEESGSVDDQFRQLPTFLAELQPTLAALEGTAEAQRPALESLRVAARPLATLLRTTASFSSASRPSVRALADLARSGRGNLLASMPNLRRLTRAVRRLPETAGNLGVILDHVNDPKWATERDSRAPRSSGYTGLEALMRFLYLQSQTTNWFDKDSYLLKNAQYGDTECSPYANAELARSQPAKCRGWLGPNQPGINQPDPSGPAPTGSSSRKSAGERSAKAQTGGANAQTGGSEPLLDFLLK